MAKPTFPKWTAPPLRCLQLSQVTRTLQANQHPQSVQVFPYLEEGGHLNSISSLGSSKCWGKVSRSETTWGKASGAVSLIYRPDNLGQYPLANTKGDVPEKNQRIKNRLGWHCPSAPPSSPRGSCGWEALCLPCTGRIQTSFQGDISQG